MALARRSSGRVSASIWPGFVDAMTALLLVMMFLLTIFMVVQFVLREEVAGQATRLDAMSLEVSGLEEQLGIARSRAETLAAERDAQAATIGTLEAERAEQAGAIASFEEQVAGLILERDRARAAVAEGAARQAAMASDRDAAALALAAARDEIDAAAEAARLAAARREALEAMTAELRAELAARDTTLSERAAEIEGLSASLDEEEAARLAEAAAAEALRERLAASDAELSALSLSFEEERRDAEATLSLLAAARAVEETLNERLATLAASRDALGARLDDATSEATALRASRDDVTAERDRLAEALAAERGATAEAETDRAALRARLEAALAARLEAEGVAEASAEDADRQAALLAEARAALGSREGEAAADARRMAALDAQVARLNQRLGQVQSLLSEAEETGADRQAEIDTLGRQLNAALAREAEEQRARAELEAAERQRLERYQSEFFGRLRDVLGDREGVEIVGDRFVFDSEVLFPSGSATLTAAGREQVDRVTDLLARVAGEIPDGIDWVIRVDGHTDDVPVSGTRYADNWELSQARALSVVKYMSETLGFPPERLAPTGFGEYRPIAQGDSPEARALNRRIELKLTER